MRILKAVLSILGRDQSNHSKAARRALEIARAAVKKSNRIEAVEAYCQAIRAHQDDKQALAAAQTAKEALNAYPGERRVLRLISRIYASKGAHAEEQGLRGRLHGLPPRGAARRAPTDEEGGSVGHA